MDPINRAGSSLADQAEDRLRHQILGRERLPGERMNEVEIARELAISRGPVREALQRLARDGLVRMEAHRGAFVQSLEVSEIQRLYEVRMSLECTAAELCAQRAGAAAKKELRSILRASAAAIRGTDRRYSQTQLDIHDVIARESGNPRLYRLIVQTNQELRLVRATSGFGPDRATIALDEHTAIVAAIEAGEDGMARSLMDRHLRLTLDHTVRLLLAAEDRNSGSPAPVGK